MTDHSSAMERRMVVRLLHYWRDLMGEERRFPPLNRVNPETIAESWDWCFVLDAGPSVTDPFFQFIGSGFADELKGSADTRAISSLDRGSLLFQASRLFAMCQKRTVPVSFGGAFNNAANEPIIFRSIILPLGDDDGRLRYLMGATSYRIAA